MESSAEAVVQVENLRKVFRVGFWGKRVIAVDHLSMDVRRGEVFGFLGPNGAGQTTTIKILMGLIYPSGGQARLFGRSVADPAAKAKLGFLPESPYFYDYLSSREFLRFYGHLFGLWGTALDKRVDELLEMVGMTHARDLQLRKFSKGMLQRVGIAQALINDPELVVLDEPMSGLDPIGRKEVRDLILRLKESGKTVLFSSHILHDAELLCDRVAMILKGRLVASGRVSELIDQGTTYSVAAKTGTAQVIGIAQDEKYREEDIDERLRDHGLFVAFAPADAPRIALGVVVENGGGGSRAAAPVARKILDAFFAAEDYVASEP